MRSSACCTCARSIVVTLGKRSTTLRCTLARSRGSSARLSVTKLCGAPSSGPGGNTTKKFGSNRAQVTSRRWATRLGTRRPCTSQTISSPTRTPSSVASSRSTEMGAGPPDAGQEEGGQSPPSTVFSVDVSAPRYVLRYSRRSVHALGPPRRGRPSPAGRRGTVPAAR